MGKLENYKNVKAEISTFMVLLTLKRKKNIWYFIETPYIMPKGKLILQLGTQSTI